MRVVDSEEWKVMVFIGEGEWVFEGKFVNWLGLDEWCPLDCDLWLELFNDGKWLMENWVEICVFWVRVG